MTVRELVAVLERQAWEVLEGTAAAHRLRGPVRHHLVTLYGAPHHEVPRAALASLLRHTEIDWKE